MPAIWDNSGTTRKVPLKILLSDGSPAPPGLTQARMLHAQVNARQCEGGWDGSSLKLGLGHLASPSRPSLFSRMLAVVKQCLHCDDNLLACQNYYFLLEESGSQNSLSIAPPQTCPGSNGGSGTSPLHVRRHKRANLPSSSFWSIVRDLKDFLS